MVIEIFGSEKVMMECIYGCERFPKAFKPLYFSENEVGIDKNNMCDNNVEFEAFKRTNPLGYFLHTKASLIDVTLSGDSSSIFIDVKKKSAFSQVRNLLSTLGKESIDYGYACEWEERHYRNGLVKKIGNSTIQNWVGRDFRQYLPGIYWFNLIPDSHLELLNIDKQVLTDNSVQSETLDNGMSLIQMFDVAQSWQDFAPDLDAICEDTIGIFSKWRVWEQLEEINEQEAFFIECSKYP